MTRSEDVLKKKEEVIIAVVEAELGLLEMESEGMGGAAVEFGKAAFGETPKTLAAIDVAFAPDKLVLEMEDPVVLVSVEDESVVGAPAVSMDGWLLRVPCLG